MKKFESGKKRCFNRINDTKGKIDAFLVDFCYIYIDSESFHEDICGLALKIVPCH